MKSPLRQLLLAILLLGGAVVITLLTRPKDGIETMWYLDLATNELFPASIRLTPPIKAPSGVADAGVLAQVVMPAAGDGRRVVYIQRYTPEAKALRERQMAGGALTPAEEGAIAGGLQIALPPTVPGQPVQWHGAGSRQGQAIADRVATIAGPPGWRLDLPGDR